MTKKELSQLYYLNREIEQLKKRIEELECLATSTSTHITGMPKCLDLTDKVGKYAVEIADLRTLLEISLKRCFYELNRLNLFIENIEDSEMRQIISLRYVNGLDWEQVAASISIYATEDSIRMRHNRFLKEQKTCSICSF